MAGRVVSGAGARKAKPKPHYTKWSKVFLRQLAATSNVTAAATKAGVCTSTVYEARRTKPDFKESWFDALCEGYELLEMETLHRLRTGELKPATGVKRGVRIFENGTSIRLLLAHRDTVAHLRAVRGNYDEQAVLAGLDAKIDRLRTKIAGDTDGDEPE